MKLIDVEFESYGMRHLRPSPPGKHSSWEWRPCTLLPGILAMSER